MKAMTILARCRAAKNDISRIQQRIDQRRELLDSIGAPACDRPGGSGAWDRDKTGRILADIDELEREKDARKEEERAEKVAAVSLLEMVPDLEGKVLYDYYIRGWDTPEIARKEKYTAGYVRKAKRNGEQLLDMLGPDRVRSVLPGWYIREKEEENP